MAVYLVIFVILFFLEKAYLAAARHFGIVDVPNSRSSHNCPIVLGGGVVIYLGALAWFVWSGCADWRFISALTILAIVSFSDDLRENSIILRLVVQFIAAALIFSASMPGHFSVLVWVVALILGVGLMNAFNFMDGINGSVGLYSLVTLIALAYVNSGTPFIDQRLLIVSALACLIFCFFNFRKKAECFAGDVGSIVIGAIIFYAVTKLVLSTGNIAWLILVAVYGADTVLTLGRRLLGRQNIFQSHRMHAYQLVSNELGVSQLAVSTSIAVLQICIDIPALFWGMASLNYLIGMIGFLTLVYICIVLPASRK